MTEASAPTGRSRLSVTPPAAEGPAVRAIFPVAVTQVVHVVDFDVDTVVRGGIVGAAGGVIPGIDVRPGTGSLSVRRVRREIGVAHRTTIVLERPLVVRRRACRVAVGEGRIVEPEDGAAVPPRGAGATTGTSSTTSPARTSGSGP